MKLGMVGRAGAVVAAAVYLVGTLASAPQAASAATTTPPPVPPPAQVTITPTGFSPQVVDAVAGQSVVFTNGSGAAREVDGQDGIFDSGAIAVGGQFTVAIPDDRTITFTSAGPPAFSGTLHVGPNGFSGPGDDPIASHLPTSAAPQEDPATFSVEPRWGLTASRTTMLVAFSPAATVADGNRLLTAIGAKVAGIVSGTGIVMLTIADRPDKSFSDLDAALATLRADPAVAAAALDTLGGSDEVTPVQPAAAAAGVSWGTYPIASGAPTGAFGLEQARFPQAWNLLDAIRRTGTDVDVGVFDSGFDLGHPELANVPGRGKHVDFVPTCMGATCTPNPTTAAEQVHGTGVVGQLSGIGVGADPLAHVVATAGFTQVNTTGGTTLFNNLTGVLTLLAQKTATGLAPNLRVVSMSVSATTFAGAGSTWATTFKNKTCGPGDDDDATGTEPCTPNNEDTYRREMSAIGFLAHLVAVQAAAKDVLIVQAAGNDSGGGNAVFCVPFNTTPCSPERIDAASVTEFGWAAKYDGDDNILRVGAVDPTGKRSAYSDIGSDVSAGGSTGGLNDGTVTAAPGGGYSRFSGTSGATPFVSGLAALVSQEDPALSASQVRSLIIAHARHVITVDDGSSPVIDAYATLTALPGALVDALDVNDPTADGNRRVVLPDPRSGQQVADDLRLGATADGEQLHTDGDGVIDMRDVRRLRDAWLQGCTVVATASCPAAAAIKLNGADGHQKKDLNLDGCVTNCATAENVYPREDPAGTGNLDRSSTGTIGTDIDGTPGVSADASSLQILAAMFGNRKAGVASTVGDTEGWSGSDVPALQLSGDLEIHPDSLFAKGATDVRITPQQSTDGGKTWKAAGKARTVTYGKLPDGVAVFTVPVAATAAGTLVRAGMSATIGGKTVTTTRPRVTLHVGQDARLDPKVITGTLTPASKTLAKGKQTKVKLALSVDGLAIAKPSTGNAAHAAPADDPAPTVDDGTEDLAEAPVTFTAEGTGDDPAAPSISSADATTADDGTATATVDDGTTDGDAEVDATVTIDDAPVTVVLPTTVTEPERLVYTWEQDITTYHRHFHGLVAPDPENPGAAGTYDYDEDPSTGSTPVILKRTGTIDLSGDTPTLDETVNDARYSKHITGPAGASDDPHQIDAPQQATTDYPLSRVKVDKDSTGITLSGLRQVSDVNYHYDCVETGGCDAFSGLQWFDSWLTITPRQDAGIYTNGQLTGFRGGDGTSFLHAPDPDADLRIRRDSAGNWIPTAFCGSGDFTFPDNQGPLYQITGTGHQVTRFTATIVDGAGNPVLSLPDCSNPAPPTARFASDPDPSHLGTPTSFTDDSSADAGIVAWAWDFGDKTTSTAQSPDHLYADSGTYPVKLTVTDAQGRSASVTHSVTVNPNPPSGSIDDQTASSSDHVVLHGRITSPSEFDRTSLQVDLSSPAAGFPVQATRRLPAGPVDIDLGQLPVGTYPITMTVTDLEHQSTTATATVIVVPGTAPGPTDPGPVTEPVVSGCTTGVTVPGEADDLIQRLDGIREQAGRLEVVASPSLQASAERHAADLATHPTLVDVGSDGSTTASRAADAGYPATAKVDELVLDGSPKAAADALAIWQGSTASGAKLVDRTWEAVGAARAQQGSSWVWVLVFGEVIDCADTGNAKPATNAHATPQHVVAPDSPASGAVIKPSGSASPADSTYPDEPVPAFTIDNPSPSTGTATIVHNRTRFQGTPRPATFDPGDGRPPLTIEPDGIATTAWYSASSPAPKVQAKGDATGAWATTTLSVAGSTITPAVAYTGPPSGAQGATVFVTATVTQAGGSTPLAGRPVSFTVGTSSVTATSGADGKVAAGLVLAPDATLGNGQLTVTALAVGSSPAASASAPFNISGNTPPIADAGGPYHLVLGTDLVFDGSGSKDPDSSAALTYAWDLGDQGTFDASDEINPFIDFISAEDELCGGTCQPDVAYPIALRVTDHLGASTIDRTTVTFTRDFELTINPPSATLNPGGTISYQVGVISSSGFTDPVNLSVTGLPAGITASLAPTATPNTSAILSLTAAQDATATTATVTVVGTADGLTRQVGGSVDLEFGLIPVCTGSIDGTVTDRETGLPVAGAEVDRDYQVIATTDANGHYSASGLYVGRTNGPVSAGIEFGKDGYWGSTDTQTIACNLTAHSSGTLLKKRTGSLSGTVTEGTRDLSDPSSPVTSTGVPLPGVTIGTYPGSALTDANGHYQVDGFPLGDQNAPLSYGVEATRPGYWPAVADPQPVISSSPAVADLSLVKACFGDLYVKVVDSVTGLPIASSPVSVSVQEPTGSNGPGQVLTDADGIAHLTPVPLAAENRPQDAVAYAGPPAGSAYAGTQIGTFSIPGCGQTGLAVVKLTSPPPVYSGNFVVHAVDDATGDPLPGIVVTYDAGHGQLTDAQGTTEWDDISLGTPGETSTRIVANSSPAGYYAEDVESTLVANQTTEVTIRLHKQLPATITGTVTDQLTGKPIAGVPVSVSTVQGDFQTDAEGHYSITGTFLDKYNQPTRVFVSAGQTAVYWGLQQSIQTTATVAGPNVVDMQLVRRCAPATISGIVRNASTGEPIQGAGVTSALGVPTTTDATGHFVLTNQQYAFDAPGPLDVTAYKDGFISSTKRVQIFCGANITLNFGATADTTTLTGTVTRSADGTPVAGAFVGSAWGSSTTTDANGHYTFADAPLGDGDADASWLVTVLPATASGLLSKAETATVRKGKTTTLDFALDKPGGQPAADAVDDAYTANPDTKTTIAAAQGVLANDTGQSLSAAIVAQPAHGTVALAADGSFTYTPPGDFVGDTTFDYTATDASGNTDTATVTIHVVGPAAPKANDDTITLAQGGSLVVNDPAKGLLANDTGTGITFTSNTAPLTGQLSIQPDGTYIYNPYYAYYGTFTVQYTITDHYHRTSTATITIHVTPTTPPTAPTATDDTATTPYQTALVVAAPGVLANDTGTSISVTSSTQPTHGSVTVNANGSYTYTPADGFSGSDSFTYTITDAASQTATATVRITVGAAPPVTKLALGDHVFADGNGNGIQDGGEAGVPGVAVQLLDGGGSVVASTATDASGHYAFDDLSEGDYGVRFTAPTGFAFSPAGAGADRELDSDPDGTGTVATFHITQAADTHLHAVTSGDTGVTVASLIDRSVDAGLVALPAGLAITETARPSGSTGPFTAVAQAPWGTGFALHVVVANTGQQALSGVAVSDAGFAGCAQDIGDLAAGASSSYDCTGTTTPTKDAVDAVHVVGTPVAVPEAATTTTGAGLSVAPATSPPDSAAAISADGSVSLQLTYSLGDRVWDDQDHDGIQDDGEPGIASVGVALLGAGDATVATTTTDAHGAYRFDGIRPGTYRVQFTRPGSYRWTVAGAGSDRTLDSDAVAASPTAATARSGATTIADGQAPAGGTNPADLTVPSIDAGLWRPSSIAGTAFSDADHDGTRDHGEPGVAGVAVDLLDGSTVVASTTTAHDGGYTFAGLVPGTYTIRWTIPAGYQVPTSAGRATQATASSAPIVVAVAQALTGVDIALRPNATTTTTTTTTTSPPTTTSTSTTTTSTPGTTSTTTPGTTTTTPATAVSPSETSPGRTPAPSSGTLPRTGQDPFPTTLFGMVLATAGGLILVARRRVRLSRR